jgi:hypothetical protein
LVDRASGAVEAAAEGVIGASAAIAGATVAAVEATADGATQLSATRRYGNNMAAAVYGLIITGAILASSSDAGDPAGELLVFMLLTLSLFWAAHVYSELLGEWAQSGLRPGRTEWWGQMRTQWPIVGASSIPALLLIAGIVDLVPDRTAIAAALAVCTAELALAGFLAARRGGGGVVACLVSAFVAFCFGLSLIILKALLH